MTPDITTELNKEAPSEFHKRMLEHGMGLVKMSRAKMSRQYESWDRQDEVYRGLKRPDAEDLKQLVEDKPIKMVVPNTYAQVMTFTSFLFLMFKQNNTFFELSPNGDEDAGTKRKDCELILERDLRHNEWSRVLFQHLLDVGRFGPSILECGWTRKLSRAYITSEPVMQTLNNVQVPIRPASEWQEFVKYEGNLVRNVSPYRFFPDLRHPLVDFQKGEFCAAEEEYSKGLLRDLQQAGEVAGIDFIQPLTAKFADERGAPTRTMMAFDQRTGFLGGPTQSEGTVLVTKMQVWIVPSKFKLEGDKPLGPEEFPVLYHLWYANDNRVIRCEPCGFWHNEFGWTVSQFTPDMHHTLSFGLADLVYRLQDVISWFVNSHITSVRRVIANRLIVNPQMIDTKTLDGEGDIYLRKGMSVPLERALYQLKVQDVTAGHMGDVEMLGKLMQMVTGVNDNAMGQYNSGRRSAQEARVVTAGAAGRMKMHGHLIWESSLGRLGRLMLSNSRQSLGSDSFGRVVGQAAAADPNRYAAFRGTPEEVICGDDYFTFDSTLSSEKGFIAQSLQDLLSTILSANPMAAAQLTQTINPAKIVDEIQYLRGAGNVTRFSYDPGTQPMVPPMALPNPANQNVGA